MSDIRARVQLRVGLNSDIPAELVSFTEFGKDNEHVALIFNNADQQQSSPMVRIHSECLTGDVFHSSRCDCGEQLNETMDKMAQHGGIILYMRQEGRGIGLYNKIDAYVLQSQGIDTYEANRRLGFGDDERDFTDAVTMLKALNVTSLKLITNNPKKIRALAEHFDLVSEVRTGIFIKGDNHNYLKTKSHHGEHKFDQAVLNAN